MKTEYYIHLIYEGGYIYLIDSCIVATGTLCGELLSFQIDPKL
jgi:hypothetical protein